MSGIHNPNILRYLTSLRNKSDKPISYMEEYAKENNVPILNWNAAELLEQLVLIKNPKRVLEIGTAIGYSTIRIAKQLSDNSAIDTIELSKHNVLIARENFIKAKLGKKINLLEGDALKIIPELKKKYDFIFLDADKEDYKQLFNLSLKKLKLKGIIFIDNLLWQGYVATETVPEKFINSTKHIKKFNNVFFNEPSLKKMLLPVGDGIGLGVKIK